jgi:hypothetical protein
VKIFTMIWPDMILHIAGCSHIKRETGDNFENVEAEDYVEACEFLIDDELDGMGWRPSDIEVKPCAR